jgi:hypothetical protein
MEVVGPSMLPTISPGSRLRFKSDRLPRSGELGLFVDEHGSLVVHRLVASFGGRHLFLGDNRVATDGWIPSEQVVGRMAGVVAGPVSTALQRNPFGHRLQLIFRALLSPIRVARDQRWSLRHASQ